MSLPNVDIHARGGFFITQLMGELPMELRGSEYPVIYPELGGIGATRPCVLLFVQRPFGVAACVTCCTDIFLSRV